MRQAEMMNRQGVCMHLDVAVCTTCGWMSLSDRSRWLTGCWKRPRKRSCGPERRMQALSRASAARRPFCSQKRPSTYCRYLKSNQKSHQNAMLPGACMPSQFRELGLDIHGPPSMCQDQPIYLHEYQSSYVNEQPKHHNPTCNMLERQ